MGRRREPRVAGAAVSSLRRRTDSPGCRFAPRARRAAPRGPPRSGPLFLSRHAARRRGCRRGQLGGRDPSAPLPLDPKTATRSGSSGGTQVSLRTQIHAAFDEVAPPTSGLPERVVQTVLTENAGRKRRERLMLRLRVPLALVAMFMLVALVVGVLVGGRLMQDWNSFLNSAPAGDSYQSQVAQLEAVPLRIPLVQSPLECQTGPYNSAGSYGSGPVYGDGGAFSSSDWGLYYHNDAYAETKI